MKKDFGLRAAVLALGLAASVAANAAPIQWTVGMGGNDHWYDFIPAPLTAAAWTWQEARSLASASTHMGMPGYLATITSAAENAFASVTVAQGGLAWIGGTDEAVEGTWRWIDGPEAGQLLTYFNWNAGEPNNCCGGENYLQTNWAAVAGWNDHGGPGNAGQRNGYLIEYSPQQAVPEPGILSLLGFGLAGLGLFRRRAR
jgi:hypothetical protein